MFLIDIFKLLLNILYFPFKFLKKKKKILFLSRQSNQISLEYKMLIEDLKKKDSSIKIKVITKKIEKNIISLISNFFLLFKQMYHLATSKIVVTDGYSVPISILKHDKDLIIVQMWHANGIIKKIGLQTLDKRSNKDKKVALKMNMHQNYDYVISSSKKTSLVFSKAFNVKLNRILNYGTPMLDYIYYKKNDKANEIKKKYHLNDKKIIVYLPTYRKNKVDYKNIISNIDFNKFQLVIKSHPVDGEKIDINNVTVIEDYIAEDIISIADYVISDYSNIVFEALLSYKKTFCYIYDYDIYRKEFGFNIDLKKEFSEFSFSKFSDIMKEIENNNYDFKKAQKFLDKYIENFDGHATDRITRFFLKILG